MKITRVTITRWRHFRGIDFQPPPAAPLVCLVGANGAGKSQVLELIASCASRVGLTPGAAGSRGDPLTENAEFAVTFTFPSGAFPELDAFLSARVPETELQSWDRSVVVQKSGAAEATRRSVPPAIADIVYEGLTSATEIQYLALDADRAYPRLQVGLHEVGQIFERDWEAGKKQSSFLATRALYEEWFKYLLAKESEKNHQHIASIRIARRRNEPEPIFVDQFSSYRESLAKVLPHLLFTGVDAQKRTIKFDATGEDLDFHQLSGGEREIGFLIGQIERFALRRGLLLIDEPELHLNAELLRDWVAFLQETVEVGQIWLATHSLDVVEAAGPENSFVLERDAGSRLVVSVASLPTRPLISALSRSMGTPAFAISNFTFVYIEGVEDLQERDRFKRFCGEPIGVRFIEAGNCVSVVRQVESLKRVGDLSEQLIRVGGIVDRDFRESSELDLVRAQGVFALDVHEVENFLLSPAVLEAVATHNGFKSGDAARIVLEEADKRAGIWIFEAARTLKQFREFAPPSPQVGQFVSSAGWDKIDADHGAFCQQTADLHGNLGGKEIQALAKALDVRTRSYQRLRTTDLWKRCEGKEVFGAVAQRVGFVSATVAEKAIVLAWNRDPSLLPQGLIELRSYIGQL